MDPILISTCTTFVGTESGTTVQSQYSHVFDGMIGRYLLARLSKAFCAYFTVPYEQVASEIRNYHHAMPAVENTNQAVLILKGLYGQHIPVGTHGTQSWDNQLVDRLKNKYDVFLFNTGRCEAEEKKEAFAGKTFQQECDDVRNAFTYCKENMLREDVVWSSVAMSFGGTILMGCPDVLQAMQVVVMIGSGCGKSPSTTKPLLSTLPDTADLLKSIAEFNGSLYFLHGGRDNVVPKESQMKIYESATMCFSRGWIEFPVLDHELNNIEKGISHTAMAAEKFLRLTFK